MPDTIVEWMAGNVQSSNPRGVKLQGEDEYHNWSKHGTPPEDRRPVPARGSKVRLGLDKDGFIRDITDSNRQPLGSSKADQVVSGGNYNDPVVVRRITLLSTLRSAATYMQGVQMPEPKQGEKQGSKSEATLKLARHWAAEVINWSEQAKPAPQETARDDD